MIGELPKTLNVGGTDYPIRSDYRNVLQVFEVFEDPDLSWGEKCIVCIYLIFSDFSCDDDVEEAVINGFDVIEAMQQINWFISTGKESGRDLKAPVYNWIKDEQIIFSAINKVAGREVRETEYMHWWTYLGYFREIGEGTFSYVVSIRDKINRGKKLEKYEREFLRENKDLAVLRPPKTKEQLEEEAENKAILDEVLG